MAPPPSTAVSPVVALIVRVLTLVFVLVSVIILATNNVTTDSGIELKFNDSYTYRSVYVLRFFHIHIYIYIYRITLPIPFYLSLLKKKKKNYLILLFVTLTSQYLINYIISNSALINSL